MIDIPCVHCQKSGGEPNRRVESISLRSELTENVHAILLRKGGLEYFTPKQVRRTALCVSLLIREDYLREEEKDMPDSILSTIINDKVRLCDSLIMGDFSTEYDFYGKLFANDYEEELETNISKNSLEGIWVLEQSSYKYALLFLRRGFHTFSLGRPEGEISFDLMSRNWAYDENTSTIGFMEREYEIIYMNHDFLCLRGDNTEKNKVFVRLSGYDQEVIPRNLFGTWEFPGEREITFFAESEFAIKSNNTEESISGEWDLVSDELTLISDRGEWKISLLAIDEEKYVIRPDGKQSLFFFGDKIDENK